MEKISWKKELYFVRYSISKFRDFLRIFVEFFLNFLGTFLNSTLADTRLSNYILLHEIGAQQRQKNIHDQVNHCPPPPL